MRAVLVLMISVSVDTIIIGIVPQGAITPIAWIHPRKQRRES